jgi:hypothetical protein
MQLAIGKLGTAYFDFNVLGVKWADSPCVLASRGAAANRICRELPRDAGSLAEQPLELGCNG